MYFQYSVHCWNELWHNDSSQMDLSPLIIVLYVVAVLRSNIFFLWSCVFIRSTLWKDLDVRNMFWINKLISVHNDKIYSQLHEYLDNDRIFAILPLYSEQWIYNEEMVMRLKVFQLWSFLHYSMTSKKKVWSWLTPGVESITGVLNLHFVAVQWKSQWGPEIVDASKRGHH